MRRVNLARKAEGVNQALRLRPLVQGLLLVLISWGLPAYSQASATEQTAGAEDDDSASITEFNTDVMDVRDRSNIDLSHFSRRGYVMPGDYTMMLNVNGTDISEQQVSFLLPEQGTSGSFPCLTHEMTKLLGLKKNTTELLAWRRHGESECLILTSLKGMTVEGDLASASLRVMVPQAWIEYSTPDWDPPSRWDEGVAGLLFDYNLNVLNTHQRRESNVNSFSGNGMAGANAGPWRLRAEWQAQRNSSDGRTEQQANWNRFYLYRALPAQGTKLTLGEADLDSGLFDSFRFVGANIATDDSMLPPSLQGYAPEVTGVARTNAKITISQQGRIIYQSLVASGPFRIQDLNQAVSGKLDVRVEEQDGGVQTFQVDTANIPYLTRPGLVRYKISAGRPTDWKHHIRQDSFATGEFSWGVTNGWSLFGGSLVAQHYNALALGVGRDLLAFGAVSLDVTESRAQLPNEQSKMGSSYRLNYSKRFAELQSQVSFAGYRFSQKDFMSMSEYLDARYRDVRHDGMTLGHSKELYTVTFNKQFHNSSLGIYGNYSHQTYWDKPDSNRWSLSMSQFLDFGNWKNISVNLTGYRSENNSTHDDGIYLSLTVPWGDRETLSYSGQAGRGGASHMVGWNALLDPHNQYNIEVGTASGSKPVASGYFTHHGDMSKANLSASFREGDYRSLGLSLQGGATATLHGTALHRVDVPGSTRLMLDTEGVSDVPISNMQGDLHSNHFGTAVIADMNSYWRNSAGVDVNALGEDMDVSHPLTQLTLTEGAIGYRKIDVLSGRKMLAVLKYQDGSNPPFGASIIYKGHQAGMVDDGGTVWLSGIKPGITMNVQENGKTICKVTLPQRLPADATRLLLLDCH